MLNLSGRQNRPYVRSWQLWRFWYLILPPEIEDGINKTEFIVFSLTNLFSSHPHLFFLFDNSDIALTLLQHTFKVLLELLFIHTISDIDITFFVLSLWLLHWNSLDCLSLMHHYEVQCWISNTPLPLHCCFSKARNQYLLTSVTSLSLSACICIHAVCVGVSNEYQLAMVTFLLCSEFVNLMLLITVQYAKSDENKNAPKLGACLSVWVSSPCPFFVCILSKSCCTIYHIDTSQLSISWHLSY